MKLLKMIIADCILMCVLLLAGCNSVENANTSTNSYKYFPYKSIIYEDIKFAYDGSFKESRTDYENNPIYQHNTPFAIMSWYREEYDANKSIAEAYPISAYDSIEIVKDEDYRLKGCYAHINAFSLNYNYIESGTKYANIIRFIYNNYIYSFWCLTKDTDRNLCDDIAKAFEDSLDFIKADSTKSAQEETFEYSPDKEYKYGSISFKYDSRFNIKETDNGTLHVNHLNPTVFMIINQTAFIDGIDVSTPLYSLARDNEKIVEEKKIDIDNHSAYQITSTETSDNNISYNIKMAVENGKTIYVFICVVNDDDKDLCESIIDSVKDSLSFSENNSKDKSNIENQNTSSNVSREYRNALQSAQDYLDYLPMSKKALYDQLVSEYGSKFSADAAQYAVDNVKTNWKENAVKEAEQYLELFPMSKEELYDQLIAEYGGQYTEEEAQYAVDSVY